MGKEEEGGVKRGKERGGRPEGGNVVGDGGIRERKERMEGREGGTG